MPLNKRGEFIPTARQERMGAERITFSSPYKDLYSNNLKYDVYMYSSNTEYSMRRKIEGVSESVAREIARQYSIDVNRVQSKATMSDRTDLFREEFFSRDTGRTGILMSNLANESGLAQVFKRGLAGVLSPQAQQNFDRLTFMVDKISRVPHLSDEFYEEAKKQFNIVGSKYDKWNANNRGITTDEGFTEDDLKELENALEELLDITEEYYERAIGIDTSSEASVESALEQMRSDSVFYESTRAKGGRKLKTRNMNW